MKKSLLSCLVAMVVAANVHGQCGTPTGLTASYANNVTTFTWVPVSGAISYEFELKQPWDPWAEWYDVSSTHTYSLTGIMHSLPVDWRVRAVCSSGTSGYQTAAFTTPCPDPSGLNTTGIGVTDATINWTAAAGYNITVSDFVMSYRRLGTTTWTSLGHTSGTSRTITGLLPNTTYEWRVGQTCPYSNSTLLTSSFTTLSCNSSGTNTSEWISRFKLGSINRSSGAESGGYVNVGSTANLTRGASYSGQIRVGYTGSFTHKVFKIYIDYNNNTIYEETEVAYGPATITSGSPRSFSLSVPATAPTGVHGMRVIMARTGTSITGCMTDFNGETEDYRVNLTGGGGKSSPAGSTEIAEVEKIAVYPNPATSNLTIQLPETVSVINVYDMVGKKIYEQQATNSTMQINVAQWPATQYIVEAIHADGHKDVTRFVKQ